jgi:hypothetical protein
MKDQYPISRQLKVLRRMKMLAKRKAADERVENRRLKKDLGLTLPLTPITVLEGRQVMDRMYVRGPDPIFDVLPDKEAA